MPTEEGKFERMSLTVASLRPGTFAVLDEEDLVIATGSIDEPPAKSTTTAASGLSELLDDDPPTNPGLQRYEKTIVGAMLEHRTPAPTRKDE